MAQGKGTIYIEAQNYSHLSASNIWQLIVVSELQDVWTSDFGYHDCAHHPGTNETCCYFEEKKRSAQ